jgi:isoleucyl-tRNA synthetase
MLQHLKSFNPPELEEKVLAFWKEKQIFKKTLVPKKGKAAKVFRFWEGPPYANGRPGIHHVLARVFKDVFLRYKTMRGYVVPRQAGWDTHGLPIEVEAEKALGISSKREIETIGVEKFNEKAKESIWRYKDEWEKLTERIGFWLDLDKFYATYTPDFIESLWWVFKRIHERGYLKEFYKVTPYCPRCQTPLSSHELGQPEVYRTVPDSSVYIKLKLKGKKNEYLLVWTTTPWTLPANIAVAVRGSSTYSRFAIGKDFAWAQRLPKEFEGARTTATKKGSAMVGWEYEPPYPYRDTLSLPIKPYSVLAADFVSTEEGTGLVHIAPAFGEDDFNLVFARGISEAHMVPETVNADGTMKKGVIGEGKFVKEADPLVVADLKKRGILLASENIEHEYPHCWRCSTSLLYFARKSWFFETSRLRKELLKANKDVTWVPPHLKEGRFGEWISAARDWALSRDRYWGTPLPIWRCASCAATMVAGSLEELNRNRARTNTFILMRHGHATSNKNGWLASGLETGRFVSRLTPQGTKDVEKAARSLAKKGIDIIVASPYRRTRKTAALIAKHTGARVIVDKRLGELNCGVFNRKKVLEYQKFFKNDVDRLTVAPEKGETLLDVRRRMYAAIRDLDAQHSGKRILIVGHGDPLWMLEAATRHVTGIEVFDMRYLKPGEFWEVPLDNVPTDAWGNVDVHRPYVDAIELSCGKCGKVMRRVPDVADVWFDSGSMPYGSVHYPFVSGVKKNDPPEGFPADFICEGIDQTRGWFYTLMAVSVLLGFGTPYRNVVSLGLVLDKYGQKMSKSRGNVVDPWGLIGKYGVDAVRWYFFTVNAPAEPKNFDEADVAAALRRFLLVVYNSYVFLHTYGKPKRAVEKLPSSDHILDRWILSRCAQVAREVSGCMDAYDTLTAAQRLETFAVEDLSRWYIRRSRRRFQKPEDTKDLEHASSTLAYVLLSLCRMTAPFIPFFSEELYQSLYKDHLFDARQSVHLDDWPSFPAGVFDASLNAAMDSIRGCASAVLSKRAEAGIKVRQPLAALKIKNRIENVKKNEELLAILADEVNVKEVIFDKTVTGDFEIDTAITPELRAEGMLREISRSIQGLRQDAGCVPKNKITLWIDTSSQELRGLLSSRGAQLKKDVGARSITMGRTDAFDAELDTKMDTARLWIGIKKT